MDLYKILGIKKEASAEEIKKAYRKAAKSLHPDVEGGDKEKFQEVAKAYTILSSPTQRVKYDNGESTETPPNAKIQAMQRIAQMLVDMVRDEHFDLNCENPFDTIRTKAQHALSAEKQKYNTFDLFAERIKTFEKRLKKDPTNQMLTAVLNNAKAELMCARKETELNIEILNHILEFIKNGLYEVDKTTAQQAQFTTSYTSLADYMNARGGTSKW